MRWFVFLFLVIVSLQSCKSTPKVDQADIVGWLPKESDTRIRLVVPGNEKLLALLLGSQMFEDLQPMIDRLQLLAIGIEYETDSVHLVALGKWPKAFVSSALDKQMERLPGRPAKWQDEKGATLVLLSNQLLIYSSNRSEEILERMEAGQRWTLNNSLGPPEIDFVMWASDTAFMRGGFLPAVLSTASKAQNGLVDAIEIMLNSSKGGNYDFRMNIKSKQESYIRPLSLVIRVMFMGILGLSKNQINREAHAQMEMHVAGGEIQIFIPSMTLEPIENIMAPVNPNLGKQNSLNDLRN